MSLWSVIRLREKRHWEKRSWKRSNAKPHAARAGHATNIFSGPSQTRNGPQYSSSLTEELAPVAPTGADDDDEQAERQIDGDDLADPVEAGASARPVLGVNSPFERQPRSVEQPDEQRDHQPAYRLHQVDVQAGTGKAAEGREHHPVAAGKQQQDRHPHPGKEFLEGDPHQLQALRRLERADFDTPWPLHPRDDRL
jgi:hypothetical protein